MHAKQLFYYIKIFDNGIKYDCKTHFDDYSFPPTI